MHIHIRVYTRTICVCSAGKCGGRDAVSDYRSRANAAPRTGVFVFSVVRVIYTLTCLAVDHVPMLPQEWACVHKEREIYIDVDT